jgi:uncharacterized protein (TIGR00297 family)
VRITSSEWKRKAVHAGMGLFALTLRWLDWKAAAAIALAALLFNLFVMPRVGRGIYRDAEKKRDTGVVAYAAMVLVLIVLMREKYLPVAAAIWAMMAFGDPAATIAGKLLGGPRLPWNPEKTWTGTLANWGIAGTSSVLIFRFVAARPLEVAAVAILMVGAALYAFLESMRTGVDDNLVAALPTALAVLQLGSSWASGPPWPHRTLFEVGAAIAVNVLVAGMMRWLGIVSSSGAVAGAVAGSVIVLCGGWGDYALLWTFFLVGTLATKWGYQRKVEKGIAQADSGRRGAVHVMANVGVPVALLLVGARPIAFAAALAAALADTLGTEFGGLYGRHPVSLARFRAVSVGASGGVSLPGALAGLLGAGLLGAAAYAVGVISALAIGIVAVAGLVGSLAESFVQDVGGQRGSPLDHEFANAFNTLVGALVALEIAASLEKGGLFLPLAGV